MTAVQQLHVAKPFVYADSIDVKVLYINDAKNEWYANFFYKL